MMEFEITYFQTGKGDNPIEEFLLKLVKTNRRLLAKTRQAIFKLRFKDYHREPLSKYIEPGIWEVRVIERSNILRIFYTFSKGQIIILLHVFIKKTQKTPGQELEIARKRLKELKRKVIS